MIYKIENEYLTAEIKSFGAELHSVKSKKSHNEYLWQGFEEIWYGQAPVLFPIIGQMLDGKYRYKGIEYEMPKHGLVRKREFEIVKCEGNVAELSIKSNEETKKYYPFDFELSVKYKLVNNSIKAVHTVINKSDGEIYFSIGAHPGFNCNVGDELEFEESESVGTLRIDNNSILMDKEYPLLDNEKVIKITGDIFKTDALILKNLKSSIVTLKNKKNNYNVRFNFGNSPYLGIWAKPGAPYVCIEPWYGVNDSYDKKGDLSQKVGIQRLNKGEQFKQIWCAEFLD